MIDHGVIHPVRGDGHLREIRQEIGEEYLLGEQWKKRQNERYSGHAKHVSKVGACRHEHVLERVGKRRPPFPHAVDQHTEVLFQQHDVRSVLGDIDRGVDGDADVGDVKGRSIIDPVPHVPHHIAGFSERADDSLFLIGFDFGKDIHACHTVDQRSVA